MILTAGPCYQLISSGLQFAAVLPNVHPHQSQVA